MGIINKIIGVILAIVLLILVPLTYSAFADDLSASRIEFNSMSNYLDIISDKGSISKKDYINFVNQLSSTGYFYKISIEIESRRVYTPPVESPEEQTLNVVYVTDKIITSEDGGVQESIILGKGDIVSLNIKCLENKKSDNFLNSFLNLSKPKANISLSKMVRNDG